MAITSTLPKKAKRAYVEKFVGGFMPPTISNYLSLYCYANKVPKTKILHDLLKNWMIENQATQSYDHLVNLLVTNILEEWKKTKGVSFSVFINDLKVELKQRQLNEVTVSKILNMVENGYKKDQ